MKPVTLFQELLKPQAQSGCRLLGLDVGDKYVGLAVSDVTNRIASPLRWCNLSCCLQKNFKKIMSLVINMGVMIMIYYSIFCFILSDCTIMGFLEWSGFLLICSVLVRKKTNIDLMATDFQHLVSHASFPCHCFQFFPQPLCYQGNWWWVLWSITINGNKVA